jgi:hypothetical protein
MNGMNAMHVYRRSDDAYLGKFLQLDSLGTQTFISYVGTILSVTPADTLGRSEETEVFIRKGLYEATCGLCYFFRPFAEALEEGQCMVDPPKSPGERSRPQTRKSDYCDRWVEQIENLQQGAN